MGADMVTIALVEEVAAPKRLISDKGTVELSAAAIVHSFWMPAAVALMNTDQHALEGLLDQMNFHETETPSTRAELEQEVAPTVVDLVVDAIAHDPTNAPRQWSTQLLPGGRQMHITGGLSFGDYPTEAFAAWNMLFLADINECLYHALGYID